MSIVVKLNSVTTPTAARPATTGAAPRPAAPSTPVDTFVGRPPAAPRHKLERPAMIAGGLLAELAVGGAGLFAMIAALEFTIGPAAAAPILLYGSPLIIGLPAMYVGARVMKAIHERFHPEDRGQTMWAFVKASFARAKA